MRKENYLFINYLFYLQNVYYGMITENLKITQGKFF